MNELQRLTTDIETIEARIAAQLEADPDHLVALAMFRADLRRAELAMATYQLHHPKPPIRHYVDGRLVA